MPALCLILNGAYYANNYAGIFDTGLESTIKSTLGRISLLLHKSEVKLRTSIDNNDIPQV